MPMRFSRTLLATLAVGALLLVPLPRLPGGLEALTSTSWADKAVHLLLFLGLGISWGRDLEAAGFSRSGRGLAVVVGLIAYGGLLEIVQGATGNRTASWGDLAADAAGAVLALSFARRRPQPAPTDPR
jgi:VanZ family protein